LPAFVNGEGERCTVAPNVSIGGARARGSQLALLRDASKPFFPTEHLDGHPSVLLNALSIWLCGPSMRGTFRAVVRRRGGGRALGSTCQICRRRSHD
jgi:hypothetical protein